MTRPVIGVLAVQGDVREHLRALAESDAEPILVRRPSDVERIDALVLPGGESTTIDKLLRAFELQTPLRERIEGGMPAYGSCAGMILLADRVLDGRPDQQTLGGMDMTVRRNAFGRQVDSFEDDLPMPWLGQDAERPMHTVFIRAPWVEQSGPDVKVLSRVEHGPAAGRVVAVRQGGLLATSFHPEITGDVRVHRYFAQMVRTRSASQT